MNEVYEKNGEVISIVSCSVPGVTFVPQGMNLEDAEKISDSEYHAIMELAAQEAKDYVDPTQKRIEELESKIDELQQNLPTDTK